MITGPIFLLSGEDKAAAHGRACGAAALQPSRPREPAETSLFQENLRAGMQRPKNRAPPLYYRTFFKARKPGHNFFKFPPRARGKAHEQSSRRRPARGKAGLHIPAFAPNQHFPAELFIQSVNRQIGVVFPGGDSENTGC